MHWLQLPGGRCYNLALAIVAETVRGDLVVAFAAPEEVQAYSVLFQGVDAEMVARRLNALAAIATAAVERDIGALLMPPGAERPRA
jgi:hypothetical protein